ncbi:class I SAM-dependent methyltransferase [Cutibacterium avidum]|uniref:class I SAM-dependent methyltransferase n=1 Tax=Cutibacterium avidum TaxID=33010 RepID=UPI00280E160B|nr:class I SAM-dependent methyltransferase [Cutibacterium avidum]MDQ9081754.1 class I SAM-dependent methyltransferase [Cutibacterium avidum]MDU5340547.1 class I SAM-dependent methyltransferase [Cutibacterium avidum]MDU5656204.1 class I SAM-dependent methyltransferase [Cutibacterium avidum]MDU5831440.1 class I SAM-dependent methyltransferase [Cutibacterium avidum]MDY0760481.1 class I SAM-dependent methyltransferase [Cutibacterium avidum]
MIFGEAAALRGGGLVLFPRQADRQPRGPRARPEADALPVTSEFDERARTQDDARRTYARPWSSSLSHPRSPGDRGRRQVRPSPAYDLVITRMTMHHVADLEHLMASVRTMLRPGGAYLAIDLTDRSADFHDHPTPPVSISYSQQGRTGSVGVRISHHR